MGLYEFSFTMEPLKVWPAHDGAVLITLEDGLIIGLTRYSHNPRITQQEAEGNARLWRAAPALYVACKAMSASLDGSSGNFSEMLAAHRKLDAATALVDHPLAVEPSAQSGFTPLGLMLAAFILFGAGLLIGLVSGHGAGFNDALAEEPVICERARDEEYKRVLIAIARTMRCSTEEEFAAGLDHECDPSEVELDAGLVNEKGEVIR